MIRQDVRLPAQLGDDDGQRYGGGHDIDPATRRAPRRSAQQSRDTEQQRERNQVLGRQDAHRASILMGPARSASRRDGTVRRRPAKLTTVGGGHARQAAWPRLPSVAGRHLGGRLYQRCGGADPGTHLESFQRRDRCWCVSPHSTPPEQPDDFWLRPHGRKSPSSNARVPAGPAVASRRVRQMDPNVRDFAVLSARYDAAPDRVYDDRGNLIYSESHSSCRVLLFEGPAWLCHADGAWIVHLRAPAQSGFTNHDAWVLVNGQNGTVSSASTSSS